MSVIEIEQPRVHQAAKPPVAIPVWAQQIVARMAAAETKIVALEKHMPAPAPAPIAHEPGTTVTTITPIISVPSHEALHAMAMAVLAQHPSLRRAVPSMSQETHDRMFTDDFCIAYERILTLTKTDAIDKTRTAIDWCADTFNWRIDTGRSAQNIWGSAFIGAALAAGVKVELGDTPATTYFGLKK